MYLLHYGSSNYNTAQSIATSGLYGDIKVHNQKCYQATAVTLVLSARSFLILEISLCASRLNQMHNFDCQNPTLRVEGLEDDSCQSYSRLAAVG